VLVNPGFPSDTATAYRLLDQSRDRGATAVNFEREAPANALVDALFRPPRDWPFKNDFLPVLEGDCGAYLKILDTLYGQGAEFAGLSGAGSTCFGVFLGRESAEKALNSFSEEFEPVSKLGILEQKDLFFIKLTFPLANWTVGY
jgi:4-diphosphocytidyl-2-C-methyl-D-erythritol kinase